jgi:hypothetical protein
MEPTIDIQKQIISFIDASKKKEADAFMKATDSHFKMSMEDKDDLKMAKFIAKKSFEYGFTKGMITVMGAYEKYKTELKMRNGDS